jgi:site-specific DNA-adenine methylase
MTKIIKRNFYFSYVGGKSKELKYIEPLFDPKKFKTFVEPFCGSCQFSIFCFNKNKKSNIVINDIDNNLYLFLKDVKENSFKNYVKFINDNYNHETTKEQYNEVLKETNIKTWVYKKKIYAIREGLFPTKKKIKKLEYNEYKDIDKFIMNARVELNNKDYKEIMEKYKDDEKALIFLDPPYFLSHNEFYKTKGSGFGGSEMSKIEFIDPTIEYIYIRNALKNFKCKIIMIINHCELLRDYFRDYYKSSYDVQYQITKKISKHMIISNL